MSEAQLILCKKGHSLVKLQKLEERICASCDRANPCWKECERCGECFCLRCEQAEFCLFFEGKPAEILHSATQCKECTSFSRVGFHDRENNYTVCYTCSNKPARKKAPIFCENKHLLSYVKGKYFQESCHGCKRSRKCRLVC